jgi:NTE family protein
MSRIALQDIRYLALEGGGGKGACYLGALKLLSDAALPGNSPPLLPLNADSRLKGLSGASAGSIVTFMLAIGMTAGDIETEMKSKVDYDPMAREPIKANSKGTPVFDIFFEKPQPGLVKSVYYESGRNVSGYAVDKLKADRSKKLERGSGLIKTIFPFVISETKSARFIKDYPVALAAGRINQKIYALAYQVLQIVIKQTSRIVTDDNLRKLADDGIEGLIKQRRLWLDCADCILYDRGLLSGNAVREYVRYLTRRYLKPSKFSGRGLPNDFTDESIQNVDPSTLTFQDLYLITGCKLVLMGTNITNQLSLPFSVDATPEFPVVDAVCLSMSIPGLFKPTFVAAEVKSDGTPETKAHNYKYKGYFVDGGMLVNIPIHAFDNEADNDVFGIGLADGVDRNERPDFQQDPIYQKYRKARQAMRRGRTDEELEKEQLEQKKTDAAIVAYLRLPDDQRNLLPNISATDERRSFNLEPGGYSYTIQPLRRYWAPLAIFADLFGQLSSTLLDYSPEAGQFRTPEERERYVPLDAYDITLTTFTPDENLALFVNIRSFNKLYWYFFGNAPSDKDLRRNFQPPYKPGFPLPEYAGVKSPTND